MLPITCARTSYLMRLYTTRLCSHFATIEYFYAVGWLYIQCLLMFFTGLLVFLWSFSHDSMIKVGGFTLPLTIRAYYRVGG